jgi:hypothetical protein
MRGRQVEDVLVPDDVMLDQPIDEGPERVEPRMSPRLVQVEFLPEDR